MDKVWLKHYPEGVPEEIDVSKYENVLEIFEKSVIQFAENDAYISMHTRMTYAELDKKSRDFAAFLQHDLGMKRGERFAIMLPNVLQYPVAVFGAIRAGLVVVNVNPLYTPKELKHQLIDSGATGILVVENFASVLSKVIDDTSVNHVITTQIGDLLGGMKGVLINTMIKRVKKMVPEFSLPHAIKFNAALKRGKKQQLNTVSPQASDLLMLQYTGGTTGVAKGVMLTHRNVVANMLQQVAMVKPFIERGSEMIVTALPLYHIFAFSCNCLGFMAEGGTNLLIANPRDPKLFAKTISKYPVTFFAGVNTLFVSLMQEPEFHKIDFSTWKLTFAGGMATQRPVAEKWQKMTNSPLLEGYGLTECSPAVSTNPFTIKSFNGSIGVPMCNTEVKILDEDGKELGVGEPGEMWVRGPQVMEGYYNRAEETAEVINDGWLATGDVAKVDDDGFIYIVDRKKDMILVSGFNVFPNEIEEVVAMMDSVLEVAAIGVPCEKMGEKVKLFLVTNDGKLDRDEVMNHCREHLTAYKLPREFELRDELPKTPVGKILRKELKVQST